MLLFDKIYNMTKIATTLNNMLSNLNKCESDSKEFIFEDFLY